MTYNLGNKYFKKKSEITDYVKTLLNRLSIGQQILGDDLELITDLLSWHPEYESIWIVENKITVEPNDFGHRQFMLNGEPFSYPKCIRSGNKEMNTRHNVLRACRRAIQCQIDGYLEKRNQNGFYTCEKTGENMLYRSDIHVDHDFENGKQFLTIVEEFLIEEKYTWNTIPLKSLSNGGHMLEGNIYSSFQNFHEKNAMLRIIIKSKNLTAKKVVRKIPLPKV